MKKIAKVVLTSMSILLLLGSGVATVINGIILWLRLFNGDEVL